MTSRKRSGLPAVLMLLALGLPALGCNKVGEDGTIAEAIILVTGTSEDGSSAADLTSDTVANITFNVADRNTSGSSTAVTNGVRFTTFTISWAFGSFGTGTGVPDSTTFLVGSQGNTIRIALFPAGGKPAAGFGDVAQFHFEGEDLVGRAVEFDANVPITIIP